MKCEEFFVYWQQVCEENKADICKAWDSKDKKFKQICTNEKWSINAKVQTGHKKEHPK